MTRQRHVNVKIAVPKRRPAPSTYVIAANLADGDRLRIGTNHTNVAVSGVQALGRDEVLLLLRVPRDTLFRLEC